MRIILILLASLIFCLNSFAQKKKKQPYRTDIGIGVKAGLNFNKVSGEEWLQTYSTNPSLGLFALVNKKRLGLQFEALWSLNTVVTDSSFYGLYSQYYNISADSLTQGTFSFHTISIPIMVNFKLTQWLWLQGGPQYTSVAAIVDQNELIASGRTIIRTGELSFVGGVWLNLGKVGPIPRFNIGSRFITGVNDLNELTNQSKWRNQRIQVHIGFGY